MKNNVINDTTFAQTELSISATSDIYDVADITTVSTLLTESYISMAENSNFEYQPPQEVLNTHFYADDIEAEIDWYEMKHIGYLIPYSYDKICEEPDFVDKYSGFKDILPTFIVDDISNYCPAEHEYYLNIPFIGIKYMLYDMNDDGLDDYIIIGIRGSDDSPEQYFIYKIYIAGNDDVYTPIVWDCMPLVHPTQYILKTKTNGLKDIMVLHNKNYPIITYEGDDSYTPCKELDERHTFFDFEILPDNILHLNMRVSVINAAVGEYYTAVKFADNTYLKNDMLYSCYSDGTPRSYIEKSIDEWQSGDFATGIDGYDFYVELTDEGVEAFMEETNVWRLLELLEIKYVAVDDESRRIK